MVTTVSNLQKLFVSNSLIEADAQAYHERIPLGVRLQRIYLSPKTSFDGTLARCHFLVQVSFSSADYLPRLLESHAHWAHLDARHPFADEN